MTNIVKVIKFTFPDAIDRSMYSEKGQTAHPFPCLFCGPGGLQRHLHTWRPYMASVTPTPGAYQTTSSQVGLQAGKKPTQAQLRRAQHKEQARPQTGKCFLSYHTDNINLRCSEARQTGGRNKWAELCEPEMPVPLNIWENAMQWMDKDVARVKNNLVDQGYRVPEPALLMTGQSPERRRLFMTNWLAIRPIWYSRLDHEPPT